MNPRTSKLILVGLTLTLTLALGCGGEPCSDPADPLCGEIDSESQALLKRPPTTIPSPSWEASGMTGVGTPACSGSETLSSGNSTSGSYQYISCTSWYTGEWGPGWSLSDWGTCTNGITNGSSDYSSAPK